MERHTPPWAASETEAIAELYRTVAAFNASTLDDALEPITSEHPAWRVVAYRVPLQGDGRISGLHCLANLYSLANRDYLRVRRRQQAAAARWARVVANQRGKHSHEAREANRRAAWTAYSAECRALRAAFEAGLDAARERRRQAIKDFTQS